MLTLAKKFYIYNMYILYISGSSSIARFGRRWWDNDHVVLCVGLGDLRGRETIML
jgi:hypothetical protein